MKEIKESQSYWVEAEDKVKTLILACQMSNNLEIACLSENGFAIMQKSDQRKISFYLKDLESLLILKNEEGLTGNFQINFFGKQKVLLTKNFIGFSPIFPTKGEELKKLMPPVVTTEDLKNLKNSLSVQMQSIKKKDFSQLFSLVACYMSVLKGGEAMGFDLKDFRHWVERHFEIVS